MATRRRKKTATKKATKAPTPAPNKDEEPEEDEGEEDPAPDATDEGVEAGASVQDAPDASSKDDSTGDPDPDATQTHRSMGGALIRAFPHEMHQQIRDEAQRRRQANGGPKPRDKADKGPEGRFGIIGGDVVCANLDCERRRLLDGMLVWIFTADHITTKRHYDNGSALCLECSKSIHKGMARRAEMTMRQLVERYGDREARRITTGQVHHGHGAAMSRMSL